MVSNYSKDPVFNKALEDATELQKNSQNTYVEDFFLAFDKIKGDKKLASPEVFGNRTLSEEVTFDMSDNQVKPVIEQKVDESILSAFEVLRKRIDKFGVTSPNIQRLGNSGRILVELPGAKDVERVKKLLQSTAQLEFWDVYRGEQFLPFLAQANEVLKPMVNETVKDSTSAEVATTEVDSTKQAEDKIKELTGVIENDTTAVGTNPILDLLRGYGSGGPVVATFEAKDKDLLMSYLNMPQVRAILPADQRYVKFAFGIQAEGSEFVDLYALIGNRDNVPELSGGVITDARQAYNQLNKPSVSMQMNSKGAKIWEEMTGRAYAQQSQIAIVLDDIVYSAPGVTTGPISGGNSEISGT
uniref:SecDF P1 head subdomain-containing protein n=1 Tax=Gelidibacter sp. TaxID=2018083 RepID=UPI0040490354